MNNKTFQRWSGVFKRHCMPRVTAIAILCITPTSALAADVTSTWLGGTDNWTSSNWSNVPNEPHFPNNGNGGFDYNAVINGGSVTLDQEITIEDLTLGGSSATTITGPSNLILNDLFTWTNGAMSGSGETIVDVGGTIALNPTAVGASVQIGRKIVNQGAATWTGTRAMTLNSGEFQNDGSFTISSGTLSAGGTGVFNNLGAFIKQGSNPANFNSGVVFNNSGTVDVQVGSLGLNGGGTHTGDFSIASGLTLTFIGTHNVEGMSDVTGPGTLRISNGTTNFNGTNTVGALLMDSTAATLSGTGTVTLTGASTWTNGTMTGAGQTTVAPGGSLVLNATAVGAVLQLNRTLVNDGSVTWTGNKPMAMNNGTFQNNGSFTVNSSSLLDASGATGTNAFNNAGTFTKQGSGTTQFTAGLTFNNSGTVDLQAGSLTIAAGGTHTGDFSIASGTTLTFIGTHNVEGMSDVTGPGTLRISNGTTNFNGTNTVGALLMDSTAATLSGTGTVTLTGASTWTNGTMTGAGQTTVAPGGSLVLNATAVGAVLQLNRTLVNDGSVTWTGNKPMAMNNGTFQNNGSFTVNSSSLLDASGATGTNAFNNAGTFTKQGSGTTQFTSGLVFNNSGTVDLQAGSLRLNAGGTHTGDFSLAAGTTLGLIGTHSFEGTTAISGLGALSISTGATNFNGTTTVSAAMNLGSVIATLSGSGTVTITGASTWTNGTMAGSGQTVVGLGGSLAISGAGLGIIHQLDRMLVNDNIVNWTGSHLTWNNGTFQNNASLTVSAPSGIDNFSTGGTNALHNAGTLTKTGAGLAWFHDGVSFNNTGTVDIQAGSLRFDSGGTHSGNFAVSAGTSLTISGTHIFTATSNVTGAGTFSNNGTIDVQGGTLTIQPSVTQLSGGNLTSGTWKVQNDSTLNITSGSNITTNFANVTIDGASSSFAKINSLVDNRGSFAILGGYEFMASGAFSNSGTVTIGAGSKFMAISGFTSSGTIRGSGTLEGNVQNSGVIRPGESPGIITIDGNLTQTASSILEIEVGGLVPGDEHDKVIVTGTATLDGRVEVPIIDGYVPAVGDWIEILSASEIVGSFASVFSPNLNTVSSDVALDFQVSTNSFKVYFEEKLTNITFVAETPTAEWSTLSTWDGDGVPEETYAINVDNQAGVAQRVEVETEDAIMHSLVVASGTEKITVAVTNNKSLSAIVGATIGEQAVIELDDGSLVSAAVAVEAGGLLAGNGTIKTNELVVSGGTLRPGFSVGHMDVEGDYEQRTDGTLLVDVEGTQAGEWDTVDITGSVQLGGTLRIDASNYGTSNPGTEFEIISAGSLAGTFESVESVGNNNIYFKDSYDYVAGTMNVYQLNRGDMNGNVTIDDTDYDLFVFGLMNASISRYFAECNCDILPQQGGDFSGNGRLDFDDIPGFQNQLTGMGMSTAGLSAAFERYFNNVPEPSAAMLTAICGYLIFLVGGRKRRYNKNPLCELLSATEDVGLRP